MVLEMPTRSKRREALGILPTDLHDSFQRIITRIRQCPRAGQAELGMRVLMWLHFSYRKLKLEELQHALAVEESHTEFDVGNIPSRKAILDCCLGLVLVDEETSTVSFVHYTLEEYFCKYTREQFPDGYSSIAKTCLTYLNFGELRKNCMNIDSLEEKINTHAFLNYAALYWGVYVKQQPNHGSLTELIKMIVDHESESPPCAIQALYKNLYPWRIAQKFSGIHAIAYFGLSANMDFYNSDGNLLGLRDESDRTPLSWAAEEGHEVVVQLLIARDDIDINARDAEWQRTPLIWAAGKGHEAVVRLLIKRNDVEINATDKFGCTPLVLAVVNRHEAVVRLLVGRDDVDVNAKDILGQTPLIPAASSGHEAIVRLLIERGDIDINTQDMNGQTPLIWATVNRHESVVRLLVERADVDINAKDMYGCTPLIWAARDGYEAAARLLIGRGDIDINARDLEHGQTPLIWAAENGREAVVRLLIEKDGVDVNAKCKWALLF